MHPVRKQRLVIVLFIVCGASVAAALVFYALRDNLKALLTDLNKLKPASAKGQYLKKVAVSTTMGPGLVVDHTALKD